MKTIEVFPNSVSVSEDGNSNRTVIPKRAFRWEPHGNGFRVFDKESNSSVNLELGDFEGPTGLITTEQSGINLLDTLVGGFKLGGTSDLDPTAVSSIIDERLDNDIARKSEIPTGQINESLVFSELNESEPDNVSNNKAILRDQNNKLKLKDIVNIFDDVNFTKRPPEENAVGFAGSSNQVEYTEDLIFNGVSGRVLEVTTTATGNVYRAALRVKKTENPEAFESPMFTVAFLFKPSVGGEYRFVSNNGSTDIRYTFQSGEVKLMQFTFNIGTNSEVLVPIRRNDGNGQIGNKVWVSPYVVYKGAKRELLDFSSLSPVDVRDLYLKSEYPKQFSGVENMYKDHMLLQPIENDWVSDNGSTLSYSTNVFDGQEKHINISTTDTNNQFKFRFNFRARQGYVVKTGEVLNCAFEFISSTNSRWRIDYLGGQNFIDFVANEKKLVEIQSEAFTNDTNDTDNIFVSFVQITGGSQIVDITNFLFYKGGKLLYNLTPTNNRFKNWSKTKYTGKKVVFVGDSMSTNRIWTQELVDRTGMYYSLIENSAGLNSFKPTARGGTTVLPIQIGANIGNNSIYERSQDVFNYEPDIIFVWGGINDKGLLVNQETGWSENGGVIPIGEATDTPLKSLQPISETDHNNQNYPVGLTFAATYMGLLENLIDNNPQSRFVILGMYPHWARNQTTLEPSILDFDRLEFLNKMNSVLSDISKKYSTKFIELFNNSGFSSYQYASEVFLSVDGTHLVSTGEYRLVDVISENLGLN